jgi:hypothetical protein
MSALVENLEQLLKGGPGSGRHAGGGKNQTASATPASTHAAKATQTANDATRAATKYGSPENHRQASIAHYAASMAHSNAMKTSSDKVATQKAIDQHKAQSTFHHNKYLR